MAIPKIDSRGLLPPGIHDGSIMEIKDKFATNPHRVKLFDDFERFISTEMNVTGWEIYIAGSFLSDKPIPNDIEICVYADQAFIQSSAFQKAISLMNRHDDIVQRYRVDYYVSFGLPKHNDFREFFQYVGEKSAQIKGINAKDKRGIVKVML